MNTENKNFEYDLNTENPLVTILKNGLIPVVKVCYEREDKGFENTSMFEFLERVNSNCYDFDSRNLDLEIIPDKGCFVYVGGIKGDDIIDSDILGFCIGGVYPTEEVLNICSINNSPLSKVNIYDKYKELYDYYLKNFKKDDIIVDNNSRKIAEIDKFSRVIIDSNKVCNGFFLGADEFYKLFDISFDGFLTLGPFNVLFESAFYEKGIPSKLLFSWGVDLYDYLDDSKRYEVVDTICYKHLFKTVAIKSAKELINAGKVSTSLKDFKRELYSLINEKSDISITEISSYEDNNIEIHIEAAFPPSCGFGSIEKKYIFLNVDEEEIHLRYSKFGYRRNSDYTEISTIADCLKDSNRKFAYIAADSYMKVIDIVKKYIPDVYIDRTLEMISEFHNIEKELTLSTYSVGGCSHSISSVYFNDNFEMSFRIDYTIGIDYNYVLDDYIINIFDNCRNFEEFIEDMDEVYKEYHLEDFYTYLQNLFHNSKLFSNYRDIFIENLVKNKNFVKE